MPPLLILIAGSARNGHVAASSGDECPAGMDLGKQLDTAITAQLLPRRLHEGATFTAMTTLPLTLPHWHLHLTNTARTTCPRQPQRWPPSHAQTGLAPEGAATKGGR
jgi:hypothetical protein